MSYYIRFAKPKLALRGSVLGWVLAIGSLASIGWANNLTVNTVKAVTPPDTCFNFSDNTIWEYYSHENNDSELPACPKDVDIPSTISGETVNAINGGGFYGQDLTSVTLPNTITTIGGGAFGYNNLSTVALPSSLTVITGSAFEHNNLTSLIIPDSVIEISGAGFSDNNLESVFIPASVVNLSGGGFSYNNIHTVTFGDGFQSPTDTYLSGNPLKHVVIGSEDYTGPASTIIPESAFGGIGLESLFLGPTVSEIGDHAFDYNSFTTLTIPESVTHIGDHSFAYGALQTVDIRAQVTAIGNYAFDNNQLTSVTLPDTLTTIGTAVWSGGSFQHNHIASIDIPETVTMIATNSFYDNDLTSLVLPDSVTELGGNAFADNDIDNLVIGNGLQKIGPSHFSGNPRSNVTLGSADYTGSPVMTVESSAFTDITGASIENLTINSAVAFLEGNSFYGGFADNTAGHITINGSPDIGQFAFAKNSIESVVINGNPTFGIYVFAYGLGAIPEDISDYGEQYLYYQNHASYVPIYTTNLDFIATHPFGEIYIFGNDCTLNEETWEWECNENYTTGGYVVNPATYTVQYRSTDNTAIAPTLVSGTGSALSDYSIAANPTGDFSQYYLGGDEIPLSAPDIDGYETPSAHTLTLNGGPNVYTFVYASVSDGDSDNSNNESDNENSLADTGVNQSIVVGVASMFGLLGLLITRQIIAKRHS